MPRLKASPKQILFASSLGITNAASFSARRLSKLINQALAEQKRTDDERIQQASDTDMLALASNYTTLKKQSWRYHCGPCPMSGCGAATDGFVVDTHHNAWFCRKCCDKGTPIGFLMKRENLSFWEAVAELVGESSVPLIPAERRQPVKKKERVFLWGQDKWQQGAQRMASSSELRLAGDYDDAEKARNYLSHERAISLVTARAWRLGQAWIKFKNWKTGQYEEANAVIMPWLGPDGLIKAIQYRLIGGASRRFHSKYGGEKTIYGAHLLAPSPDKLLLITEGEFNAISLWQEAQRLDLPVDVISIGGEGISEDRLFSLVKLVARYRGCAAWLDRVEITQKVGGYFTRAMLLKSPDGHDANKLAQIGELAGIVEAIYQRFESVRVPVVASFTIPTTIPAVKEPTLDDLLNDAGWIIESFRGEALLAKGDELYRELEDAVYNGQIGAAYSIHARIKMLATEQAWAVMGAAQGEQGNALYL